MIISRGKALVLAVSLVVLASAGCNWLRWPLYIFSPAPPAVTVPAQYDGLKGRSVAVVISAGESTIYEHPGIRLDLAGAVNAELEQHIADITTVAPRRVVRLQEDNPDWAAIAPADLGRRLETDFVLLVTLLDYGLREPGSATLFRGRLSAEAELFETASAPPASGQGRVWRSEQIGIAYPETGRPVMRINGDVPEIREEIITRFATVLVKHFRQYEVEAPR